MTGSTLSRRPVAGHQRAGRASLSGYDASLAARRSASGTSPASPTRPARPACLAHVLIRRPSLRTPSTVHLSFFFSKSHGGGVLGA